MRTSNANSAYFCRDFQVDHRFQGAQEVLLDPEGLGMGIEVEQAKLYREAQHQVLEAQVRQGLRLEHHLYLVVQVVHPDQEVLVG